MDLSLVYYAFIAVVVIAFAMAYVRVVWICADRVKKKFGFGDPGWFVSLILLLQVPPLTLWVYLFMDDPPTSEK